VEELGRINLVMPPPRLVGGVARAGSAPAAARAVFVRRRATKRRRHSRSRRRPLQVSTSLKLGVPALVTAIPKVVTGRRHPRDDDLGRGRLSTPRHSRPPCGRPRGM